MPNRADWISATMDGPWDTAVLQNYIKTFYYGYGNWVPALNVSSDKGGQSDDYDKYCKNIEGIQIK